MGLYVFLSVLGMLVGLAGLWWSSDKAVEHSIQLSDLFGVTKIFIGFVFMAVATGLPELAIAITSMWENIPGVAVGTIIGSNLGDVSLVLGVPAVIFGTLNVKKEDKLHLMFLLMITALVMGLVFILGTVQPWHGFLFFVIYIVLIWWLWKTKAVKITPHKEVIEELSAEDGHEPKPNVRTKLFALFKVLTSFAFVLGFSKLAVYSAEFFAHSFAIRVSILGATIFAVGTSLPEVVLSIQAVKKKEYSLAFGNSFGSILEQALLILGLVAIGSKKPLNIVPLRSIAPLMFIAYAIVAHSLLKKTKVGRQEGLGRIEGGILIGLFVAHILYSIFWR